MLHGVFRRQPVPGGQIHDVDEIPAAGAVRSGVIPPEHGKPLPAAHRHLCDERHEIIGDPQGVLPDEAGGVRPNGIEVPQQHRRKAGIRTAEILQHLLDHRLGAAVGAGALPAGHLLPIGDGILRAVNGGGGGKDEPADARFPHALQHGQGGIQIGAVVGQRYFHRLPHRLFAGKMDDAIDGLFGKDTPDGGRVGHIRRVDGKIPPCDGLYPLQGHRAAVGIIIRHDDITAVLKQFHGGVAADIPGAAGE